MTKRGVHTWAAGLALLATGLSGCASSGATESAQTPEASIAYLNGWAKASDGMMTGVFGVLANEGTTELTLTSASCQGASATELHETVAGSDGTMQMRPVERGLSVPAGGELELAPGGNHIMLMGLSAPILAGDTVSCSLGLSDGSTLEIAVPAKDFAGANENYQG